MKQFLNLLFIALLVGCNNNEHREKDLNVFNTRDYFNTPESFVFKSSDPDNSDAVRNAITDSLKLNTIIMYSDSLGISSSVKTFQITKGLTVDFYYKTYIEHDEYIDVVIDTLVFKEFSGENNTKSNTFFNVALPADINVDLLKKDLEEEFVFNMHTNRARVSGNLDNQFILSVYESEKECGVSFKLVTNLRDHRLYSRIIEIESYNDDSINTPCNKRIIDFYKNNIRERLLVLTFKHKIRSELNLELPVILSDS